MPKRYRLYLDESGDHTKHDLERPERRYLGLTGIILPYGLDHLEACSEIEALKTRHFPGVHPDERTILHREDMRNGKGCFIELRQNQEKRTAFDIDLISTISKLKFEIITVVIDKKGQIERYKDHAFDPYEFGFVAILERYCGWLSYHGGVGDVVVEKRGKIEDRNLRDKYSLYYTKGTGFPALDKIKSTFIGGELNLRTKDANVAGLQIADLVAYPSKQEILIERGIIEDKRSDFSKQFCKVLQDKYNIRHDTNNVWGYGKVFKDFK